MADKCPPCKQGAPAYMATFADLMSLLLTFFVLLISMASFEPTKFQMTAQSLQGAFGVMESFPTVAVMPHVQIPKHSGDEAKKKQALQDAKKMEEVLETKKLDDAVKVDVTEEGIHIKLKDGSFSSGSADLEKQGTVIIEEISKILKTNEDLKIRVEGHTDDVPLRGGRYGSNWELSSMRALSVVKTLAANTGIAPLNMSAVGFGEFRPQVPNTTSENRAKNRRIEIFVDYVDKDKKE